MKLLLPLLLLPLLFTGNMSQAISVSPRYVEEQMQKSKTYLARLQQASTDCSEVRLILRRIGQEPLVIPLSQENQKAIRKLIMQMQPVVADFRMKLRKSYSAKLQFVKAGGKVLMEFETIEVSSGSGWSPSPVSLSKDELKQWRQHTRQEDIEKIIRQQ